MLEQIPADVLLKTGQLNLEIQDDSSNGEIGPLLNKTLLVGGKRLRPMLTILMGQFFGVDAEKVAPFARAIEMVHAATLAHDDVIDNATTRRGEPSINIVSTNKKAILSGDYLLAQIMMELSQTGNTQLVYEMSLILKDLVDGEWLQTKNKMSQEVTWDDIELVARKKTASVIQWCCIVPAILTNQSEEIIEKCRQFGIELGLAFQMVDDVLDFEADIDKDKLQDVKNGILNTVTYELIKLRPEAVEKLQSPEADVFEIFPQEDIQTAAKTIREKAINKLRYGKMVLNEVANEIGQTEETKQALNGLEGLLTALGNRRH